VDGDSLTIAFLDNQNGSAELVIQGDSNGLTVSDGFTVVVQSVNDNPTITLIDSQEVYDTATNDLSYTISDVETAVENLSVTLLSSNHDLIPILPEHVFMTEETANRTLVLTPVEGAYGTSMLTLVVQDENNGSATSSFALENIRPSFTIFALADGNGNISPSGNISVLKGNDLNLSFVPMAGNAIDDVRINDESIGSQSQYTFRAVAQNYTIKVQFVQIPAPIANFYAEPLSGDAPLVVDFINTSENEISSVEWIFGDNTKSSASSPVHSYALPGNYTVCLRLTGPGGSDILTKSAYILVNTGCSLDVQFSANQRVVPTQTDVQMIANVSDFSSDLVWDFGDGTGSQQRNPLHSYTEPGIYDIRLTAYSESQNCSKSVLKEQYIQVVGRKIVGQVRAGGTGIENCLVSLWYNQTQILKFTYTDENGFYTLNNLPPKSNLVLSVTTPAEMRDQYMLQYYPDATLWANAELISTEIQDLNLNIDLLEPPNNGICGQVTDGIHGIDNAIVSVYSTSLELVRSVISDSNGQYSITGLPLADDYIVSAWLSTIQQEYFYSLPQGLTPGEFIPESSVTRYSKATLIQPEEPCLVNINMIVQNALISGLVISNGEPLSNVWINAWSNDLECSNGNLTDENGRYTITGLIAVDESNAMTKGYLVEIQSSGYPYQVFDQKSNADQATLVETGRQDIDFELVSNRQITGSVTDTNGLALSGALIHMVSKQTEIFSDTYADENGLYTFSQLALADDYIAYAFLGGYPIQYFNNASTEKQAQKINLLNNNAENIDFVMDKGAIIFGSVTFLENSQPVGEGLWVNIWSDSLQSGGDVPTDQNGNYEITGLDQDADDYIISIWHQDYLDVFYSTSGMAYQYTAATPISPSDDQKRDLALTSGLCIHGLVSYMSEPADNIIVWADGPATGMATTDLSSSSNYSVCGLAPGSYVVSISSDQYMDDSYPIPVIIDSANQSQIDFQLAVPERSLSGVIYGVEKDELLTLLAWSRSTDWQDIIRISGTGNPLTFEFTDLKPASDYRLKIRSDHYEDQVYNGKTDWTNATIIDLSTENVSGIEITLTALPCKITGYVIFPDPLVDDDSVSITAFSEQKDQLKTIEVHPGTGGTVAYTITGLSRTTDYIVYLSATIYEQQYYPNARIFENAKHINTQDDQMDENINFTVTPGGSISGQVFNANNQPVSNMNVMVWSDLLTMGATGKTNSMGNYLISGLNAASDYVVSVQDDTTTFYYHPEGTVVQEHKKGFVVLTSGEDETGIDISLISGDSMKGTVRNTAGAPIANVWISAWSESLDSGGSCFTNSQGQFTIKNLLSGQDYTVETTADNNLGYINQVKSNIQSNAMQVDFILKRGYILSGQIKRPNQSAVANVVIDICSISQHIFENDTTDDQGNYDIQGLPSSSDYIIQATPPDNSQLSLFEEQNFVIDDHTYLPITLDSALSISGTIQVSVNDSLNNYTMGARINVYSDTGFTQQTDSDSLGNFVFYHVPDGTNYQITVYANHYADQTLYQVAAGDDVDIVLSDGKSVQGEVKNSRGQPISDARVEIFSEMINLTKSTITDQNGSFIITGLPDYYNASAIDDYILSVDANNYPETQKSNIMPGDTVSIVLDADEALFISGTVTDFQNNSIPEGISVVVRLFELKDRHNNTKMKARQTIIGQESFSFQGLDANKQYALFFKEMDNSSEKYKEWAGENNIGVDNKNDAIFYAPGQTVMFRFSGIWH